MRLGVVELGPRELLAGQLDDLARDTRWLPSVFVWRLHLQLKTVQRDVEGLRARCRAHERDEDCRPYLDDNAVCTLCGVHHGEVICECGGRGFHRPACRYGEPR